jgi:hypothetical protein
MRRPAPDARTMHPREDASLYSGYYCSTFLSKQETLQAKIKTPCGGNSTVECNLPKVEVAGSSPVPR